MSPRLKTNNNKKKSPIKKTKPTVLTILGKATLACYFLHKYGAVLHIDLLCDLVQVQLKKSSHTRLDKGKTLKSIKK